MNKKLLLIPCLFIVSTAFSSPIYNDSIINLTINMVNTDSVLSHLNGLQNLTTRNALQSNRKNVALYIASKYLQYGADKVYLDSFPMQISGFTLWQYNVIALKYGWADSSEIIVFGGHYDSMPAGSLSPGADDNASGVTATFEVCRVLTQAGLTPRYTIRFAAFAAEEYGLLGSRYDAGKLKQNKQKVRLMINHDMIATAKDSNDFKVNIHIYKNSESFSELAYNTCLQFSDLQPVYTSSFNENSDSYSYATAGFKTVYFAEYRFSQYYHTINDLVANCNPLYCSKVIKLSLATLLKTMEMPSQPVNLEIDNPADGSSLTAHWQKPDDISVVSFRITIDTVESPTSNLFYTSDTFFVFDQLASGIKHYISVSSVNTDGITGIPVQKWAVPATVTLDRGILLIDDSQGGIMNPTDEMVDSYYLNITRHFQVTTLDAAANGGFTLKDLGPYSTVVIHQESKVTNNFLSKNIGEIGYYLQHGGKLLISVFGATTALTGMPSDDNEPVFFENGPILKYLQIKSLTASKSSYFYSALPAVEPFQPLTTDTTKTGSTFNHHIRTTEKIETAGNARYIYTHHAVNPYQNTSNVFEGQPVGIITENNKCIFLSFSLYYISTAQAANFIDYALNQIFEEPLAVEETTEKNRLIISPNPASDYIHFELPVQLNDKINIQIFNSEGKIIFSKPYKSSAGNISDNINIENLPDGLYILKVAGNYFCEKNKFLKIR